MRESFTPERDALLSAAGKLAGNPVLVVGDVMLDHYLSGDAERISPEAPIPVVRVAAEGHLLGGAGNVARNISALGGKAELVSVIGPDDPGRILQDLMTREGIQGHLVVEKRRMTTIKTRIIARGQQMLRVDREESTPLAGSALEALTGILREKVPSYPAVLISDYGKGVVCQAVMDVLRSIRSEGGGRPMILVDPKVVNAGMYSGVDLLTPNAKEAAEISGLAAAGREGVIKAGLALFKRLKCRQLCVTLGAEGMAVFESPGVVRHVPTVARSVYDVTGAGDTVIAVLSLALAAGCGLTDASVLANFAAGVVVGQVGAAVCAPEALRSSVSTLDMPHVERWLDID